MKGGWDGLGDPFQLDIIKTYTCYSVRLALKNWNNLMFHQRLCVGWQGKKTFVLFKHLILLLPCPCGLEEGAL